MNDAESVRSGRSERSERSQRSRHHGDNDRRRHRQYGGDGRSHSGERKHSNGDRGAPSRTHRDRYGNERETDRDTEFTDHEDTRMHTRPTGGPGKYGDAPPMDGRPENERIEVQILPQDDNWLETNTAVSGYTGATSETGFSGGFSSTGFDMLDDKKDMNRLNKNLEDSIGFNCARYIGSVFTAIIVTVAFISPIIMVILPKVGIKDWTNGDCDPACEGLFISFTFKLLILLIGSWALFLRKPKATMPRIFIFRALLLFLVFLLTFAFWLFYGVRIFDKGNETVEYHSIVQFADSLVDALLFIHYVAIILLEIRQLQQQFVIRVMRSPDGETQCYTVGQLSIQRLAVWVLEQYYKDFPSYNPYLESVRGNARGKTPKISNQQFKVYEVDGVAGDQSQAQSRAIFAAAARRRDSGHNDRFYEQEEYERRVKKRRARLIVAAEEAFTHVKRMQEEKGPAIPMDPQEAAQAIFPALAKSLQKYLRITRQQPRYSVEEILAHLAMCVSHDVSPKAFLQQFMTQGASIWNDREYRDTQTWTLICEQLLSRSVDHDTLFQLRQGDVSLLVQVRKLPHFNLTEEVINPKNNKFVLRLNSETSV